MLNSENIIKYHDCLKSANHYYLIIEYCNSSDLETLLDLKLCLNERQARLLYKQVLLGMRELQRMNVMHRDIKNANLLVNISGRLHAGQSSSVKGVVGEIQKLLDDPSTEKDVQVKLADFGFAAILDKGQAMRYYCGTPLNMAPEVLHDKFYTYKADMWSFGVAMFEALCH